MTLALYVLVSASVVGAADTIIYHIVKFRLYERPQSVVEMVTHLVRTAMFLSVLIVLLSGRPVGAWFWLVVALFLVDTVNSAVDVAVEPSSRAPGRVPPTESVLHTLGATLSGVAFGAFVFDGWSGRSLPSSVTSHPPGDVPTLLLIAGWLVVAGAAAVLILESTLFATAARRRRAASLTSPLVNSQSSNGDSSDRADHHQASQPSGVPRASA